ncbi:hypothetical protein CSIM01_12669 [Colletotrichum simmondsii]|uniref:Uncharacterized protein n=1 Tax=Colletotrichum simmondsii TaxID=703756 RepID=A0A135TFD5_9PEZI|nr:hypothetical protein CSIM01_12669 [Colletotrichum simmondsii]
MAHGGNGPWQLPYLRQLQPFEIVASLLDSNDHKKAEPQAQPGKTRILDGNHPPGPLHYSLTAPPSKVPSNSLASTSHNTTSPHKPKATTIHLNVVYATLDYLPTPDYATLYVTTGTNLVRSQIPPCPGSRLVWSHLARRRLLPLPRRIRRFCCDVLLLRRPFFLSNPNSPGFSPPSTDVMGCESTSCPGRRGYTHSHGSNNSNTGHTRHGSIE